MSQVQVQTAKAIVSYHPEQPLQLNWKLEDVKLRQIEDHEVLVDMVASGLCHTDVVFGLMPVKDGNWYPRVLGHEGAGYVKQVGAKVTAAKVGDPVLMSFITCNSCSPCKEGHLSFCDGFSLLNYGGAPGIFEGKETLGGQFFGQSSFSSLSVVNEKSIVNAAGLVRDREELKLFAPLGCGFQSGAGTITELAAATDKDTLVILGMGGVGLAALMAAKIKGLKTIIGVDRFDERLAFTKSLGATHVINTSAEGSDLVAAVKEATGGEGATIVLDTTGNPKVIADGIAATRTQGQMILLGVPPSVAATVSVNIVDMIQKGKNLRGSIEGDTNPQQYVKQMIQWYRDGLFPIEKLVKYYEAKDFMTALGDVTKGLTIKPVLVW